MHKTPTMQVKTINFPYIALPLGLLILAIVARGSQTDSDGVTALPLLTLLIAVECAFILCAVGTYTGIKYLSSIKFNFRLKPLYTVTTLLCILLSIQFMLLGIKLWPL